jgi:hypothetical protein
VGLFSLDADPIPMVHKTPPHRVDITLVFTIGPNLLHQPDVRLKALPRTLNRSHFADAVATHLRPVAVNEAAQAATHFGAEETRCQLFD